MRKIVAGIFMSLDGVYQGPGPTDEFEYPGWTMPFFNDEVGMYIGSRVATADAMLLGRNTYEAFAATFSPQTGGMADAMNNLPKYVVSTTLERADWNNSTLIRDQVADEVAKIKAMPGQDISISGSGRLVKSLLPHGLIDELSLLVFPLILGVGSRLFPEGLGKIDLKLIEAKGFSNGVVLMRYDASGT